LILSLNSKDLRAVLQQYPDTEQQMRIEARRRLDHTASWNRRKRKRSWSDPPRFQGRSSASGRVDFGEIKEKLRRISLFRNLPDLIFDRLAETVSIRHYGQSMYIFRQDR
jgi:CRP-like cAMP-binding protein